MSLVSSRHVCQIKAEEAGTAHASPFKPPGQIEELRFYPQKFETIGIASGEAPLGFRQGQGDLVAKERPARLLQTRILSTVRFSKEGGLHQTILRDSGPKVDHEMVKLLFLPPQNSLLLSIPPARAYG